MLRATVGEVKAEYDRQCHGFLPFLATIGYYPLFYITEKGQSLCANCASSLSNNDIILCDILWENPNHMKCDLCDVVLDAAYETEESIEPD